MDEVFLAHVGLRTIHRESIWFHEKFGTYTFLCVLSIPPESLAQIFPDLRNMRVSEM